MNVAQQVVNGDWRISGSVTMEVMKMGYLLLDSADDNSVLFFLLTSTLVFPFSSLNDFFHHHLIFGRNKLSVIAFQNRIARKKGTGRCTSGITCRKGMINRTESLMFPHLLYSLGTVRS